MGNPNRRGIITLAKFLARNYSQSPFPLNLSLSGENS